MELRVLHYFLAVAREENVTHAAQARHLSKPTLSRQLAQMEEELGVRLFERGKRKITLTAEGVLLRRRAKEILELAGKTERELREQAADVEGTVAVGCGDLDGMRLLPELFRSFHARYPRVQFDLYTATADHILALASPHQPQQGTIDSKKCPQTTIFILNRPSYYCAK